MSRNIHLRRGIPQDSEYFGDLVAQSAGELLYAFGDNANAIFKALFTHKRNLFSFQYTQFAILNSNIAGMVLGYDWKVARQQGFRTGLLLFRYMKFGLLRRMSVLTRLNTAFGAFQKGDFYISNIAVYPQYRGLGIAKDLLATVESEAQSSGSKRLILDVAVNNREAISWYLKMNYTQIEGTKEIVIHGKTYSFFRMFKIL